MVCVETEREVGSSVGLFSQALWFTSDTGSEGLAFGNTEVWRGLGIMLDSFDNNGLVRCLLVVKATCIVLSPSA